MIRSAAQADSALWALARRYGAQPSYTSVDGTRCRASRQTVVKVLQCLGCPLEAVGDAPAVLQQLEGTHDQPLLQQVYVHWDSTSHSISINVHPQHHNNAAARLTIDTEQGETHRWDATLAPVNNKHRVELAVPMQLPHGYHSLTIETGDQMEQAHLFRAPARAFEPAPSSPPAWGVFMPLYALHSQRSWGIGDLSDLRRLSHWVASHGASSVGILPLLAAQANASSKVVSPYSPTSRRYFSEVYLDVSASPEFHRCPSARECAASPEVLAGLSEASASQRVDYERVSSLKRQVLEPMASCFFATESSRRAAFEQHIAADHELQRYALFRAAQERYGRQWQQWPKQMRDGAIEIDDVDPAAVQYHLYVQWLLREQLADAARVFPTDSYGLYLDIPVGVAPDAFDIWNQQNIYVPSASFGAPPDAFFTHGQDWGLVPLHPQRSGADGHRSFREMIRAHCEFAGSVRIDHVMGLHRLYWIPQGNAADEGMYVRYPADEFYAILCIESQRAGVGIVGENLGTVPASVNRAMKRHGISPLYVAQFSWTGRASQPLSPPQSGAVTSLNTHDVPMFAAFWRGDDIDLRLSLGLVQEDDARTEHAERSQLRQSLVSRVSSTQQNGAHAAMSALQRLLQLLMQSDAGLVLVTLEDLWLERRPQNVPGTNTKDNWTRKSTYSLEQMIQSPDIARVFEQLSASGRRRL